MSADHTHGGAARHSHGLSPEQTQALVDAEATASPWMPAAVEIYDTTLRDGSQQEGLWLSVDDKLKVAEQLDHLGVAYIEGGWPGANPKDDEFFRRAGKELVLRTARLVAFGSTRKAGTRAETDPTLAQLLDTDAEWLCLVAKAWDYHVTAALRTTLDEARAMVFDSVSYLVGRGRQVFLDAEHFFDGFRANPDFAVSVLEAAADAGARAVVLCDTNGGALPHQVEAAISAVRPRLGLGFGVHFHNDSACAVANSLVGVRMGATQVQACCNGYGERAGNADLTAVVANLSLKLGVTTIPADRLERLTPVSRHIAELVNIAPNPQQPYVGAAAFAHKAGLHVSAIVRARDAYEHIAPERVGNGARFVVSELAGKSTLAAKATELGLDLDGEAITSVLEHLKALEHRGYHFEAADASLELLLRTAAGWRQDYFRLETFRVTTERREQLPGEREDQPEVETITEATVKVHVAGQRILAVAEGNGPVNALDAALRKAIGPYFEQLAGVHLTDFRVRVLDSGAGTAATTRVLIDSSDGDRSWSTIGVSDNVIEASWQALADSIVFGLLVGGSRQLGSEK
jgi:2-isopropylmalate synthase